MVTDFLDNTQQHNFVYFISPTAFIQSTVHFTIIHNIIIATYMYVCSLYV